MKTKTEKRRDALVRLEKQLKSGVKTAKGTFDKKEPLTEKDVKRIKKNIEILKERVPKADLS